MSPTEDPQPIRFATQADWRAWLDANHADERELWLECGKKGSGIATVTYAEALDVALCYGWIDGQARRIDDRLYMQRFTPRSARSKWSMRNRELVHELIERGAMQPAGLREIERAQADGRWDAAYPSPKRATVPDDLQAALDADPEAKAFFATVSRHNRYAILHRIHDAKRPETRARRIATFVGMLHRGELVHPDR